MIYTLQQSSKKLSIVHRNKNYYIGFQKVNMARKVQYSLHPEPNILLVRGDPIKFEEITFDTNSFIFIPKCHGSIWEPMNDAGFHMNQVDDTEFSLNLTVHCGIIMPDKLVFEDDDEFIFSTSVFDPIPTIRI